jgi:hypothetical protein
MSAIADPAKPRAMRAASASLWTTNLHHARENLGVVMDESPIHVAAVSLLKHDESRDA